MSNWTVDLDNKDKHYLNEKELFIIYWLLKKKHISTGWSNVFTLDNKHTFVPQPTEPSDVATIEEDINNAIEQSTKRIHDRMRSPVILRYLLDTGKVFDEKGFMVYGDADYSLVEGGFLSEYVGETMIEYSNDTKENRKNNEDYKRLNKEQINFLDEIIKGKKFDSIKFSKLAHPTVKEYQDAILKKEAEEDFIELVNKLIPEYDGSKWNTKDIEKFLDIWYKHNKEQFRVNALTEKTVFHKDSQTQLAGLIFEYANFGIFIKNTKKLQTYFNKYLNSFIKDELNGASSKGLTGTFFKEGLTLPLHTQFFGFKKQRDMLIKHIEGKYEEYQRDDLEIGHPYFEPEYIGDDRNDTVKITVDKKDKIKDLFLFVHTMLALEDEGYLEIEDFSYGPKQMFDMYDRGFLFTVRLKKNRKINEINIERKSSKPLSFNEATRKLTFMNEEILIAKKEESDPHKLIRTLFKDINKVWASDEILEDWGYSFGEDIKKNKAYQAGKAVNRTIAQETKIKDFLDVSTKSISINIKYLKHRKSL